MRVSAGVPLARGPAGRQVECREQARYVGLAGLAAIVDGSALAGPRGEPTEPAGPVGGHHAGEVGSVGQQDGWELRLSFAAAVAGYVRPDDVFRGRCLRLRRSLETMADPTHPEHESMLDWLGIAKGADFDPARFDTADANRRLDTVVYTA
jgi:hypothetical protein